MYDELEKINSGQVYFISFRLSKEYANFAAF